MVEDRITDGKRIAELLASELTGLDRPPLDRLGVVDANPDATPAEDGTLAYRVAMDGDAVGEVVMYPDRLALELSESVPPGPLDDRAEDASADPDAGDAAGGRAPPALDVTTDDGATTVTVESGAAVKRVRDLLATVAENRS